jgi:hypothetical protein
VTHLNYFPLILLMPYICNAPYTQCSAPLRCRRRRKTSVFYPSHSLPRVNYLYFTNFTYALHTTQCSAALQKAVQDLCVQGAVAGYTPKPANFIKLRNAVSRSMRAALERGGNGGDGRNYRGDAATITSTSTSTSSGEKFSYAPAQRAFGPSLRRPLFERQGGKCALCLERIDESRLDDGQYVHIDHDRPYSNGGKTELENAQLTHRVCNQEKGARWIN